MTKRLLGWTLGLLLASSLNACGSDSEEESEGPTGSVCPTEGTDLTYENFAQGFFEDYCLSCHSSSVTGNDRNDAPEDVNFDTLAGILAEADEIDSLAAAGPDSTNKEMPDGGGAKPSDNERRQLGEWLACQ